jgi:four helix bundle protein
VDRPHYKLEVWRDAIKLTQRLYAYAGSLPELERFGLQSQLRRAGVSVPSNIAEGAARGSSADYQRFLFMARGSLSEIDTQLEICKELGYPVPDRPLIEDLNRVFAKLNALITKLSGK